LSHEFKFNEFFMIRVLRINNRPGYSEMNLPGPVNGSS